MNKSPKKHSSWFSFLGRTHKKRQSAFSWLSFLRKKKKVIRYRDSQGRFISKPMPRPLRDKYGRFKKQPKYRLLGQPLTLGLALKTSMVVIGLLGSLYFGSQLWAGSNLQVSQASAPPSPAPVALSQEQKGMVRSEPTRINIPAAGIDTSLITLGKTETGTLEVPKGYDVAGWYKYSPTPGEIGPAVIVGHVDNYLGAAVFYNLRNLKAGDVVGVTRADGQIANFKVSAVEQYSQDNFPTDKVYGNTKQAEIRLITCGGKFNYITGNYSDNTVVFGSIIPN